MDFKENIQKYLPHVPELIQLLKEKFSKEEKMFPFDNGELIYDGELAIGTDMFVKHGMEECILEQKEKGMSKEDAKAHCSKKEFKKIPAPTKTYKHEDGTELVVESGKIVDIKKSTTSQTSSPADFKAFVEEIFKAFPKTDLSEIEKSLTELKATLSAIQTEKSDLKAKVDKFEGFKTDVIAILEKFSTAPSTESTQGKTNSSANNKLSLEDWRKKFMQHQN
mgnify:CR=1 FL=1